LSEHPSKTIVFGGFGGPSKVIKILVSLLKSFETHKALEIHLQTKSILPPEPGKSFRLNSGDVTAFEALKINSLINQI
jgi:hypothetical protein